MSSNLPSENLTSADRIALLNIQQKAWFTLVRTYGVFFLALIFLYWRMYPGSTFRGAKMRMSVGEYRILYWCITTVFGSIFALFCYRDYKRLIAPLRKDLALGQCQNRSFYARKYADPVYDKLLLFHPEIEDLYIELSKPDWDLVSPGDELQFRTTTYAGEILQLTRGEKVLTSATTFSFKDMPEPKFFKYQN